MGEKKKKIVKTIKVDLDNATVAGHARSSAPRFTLRRNTAAITRQGLVFG